MSRPLTSQSPQGRTARRAIVSTGDAPLGLFCSLFFGLLFLASIHDATAQPVGPEWVFHPSDPTLTAVSGLAATPAGTVILAATTEVPSDHSLLAAFAPTGPPALWTAEIAARIHCLAVDDEGSTYVLMARDVGSDFYLEVRKYSQTGAPIWTYTSPEPGLNPGAVAVDSGSGSVYVASGRGPMWSPQGSVLIKLSAASGAPGWQYEQPGSGLASVALDADGLIYIQSSDLVTKVDVLGNLVWSAQNPENPGFRWTGLTAYGQGNVYAVGERDLGFWPWYYAVKVVRLGAGGVVDWGHQYYDQEGIDISAPVCDEAGDVYAAVNAQSPEYSATGGYGATGNVLWGTIDPTDIVQRRELQAVGSHLLTLGAIDPDRMGLVQYGTPGGDVEWTFAYGGETGGGATGTKLAAVPGGASLYVAGVDLGLARVFLMMLMRENTAVEPGTAPPAATSLLPPRPNPMSDRTEIVFDLPPTGASVILDVVDVSGRVVTEISRGPLAAGRHQAVWRRESSGAERIPAGVYFLRLNANGVLQTQKIVLKD